MTSLNTVNIRSQKTLRVCLALALVVLTLLAFASTSFAAVTAEQASDQLTTFVYGKLAGNSYEREGGGNSSGSELFVQNGSGYDVNSAAFDLLSKKGQKQFAADVVNATNNSFNPNTDNAIDKGVTNETAQNWLRQLQTKPGFGSQVLNAALANSKPDFVTANKIWAPFQGVVGIILGVLAIIVMSLLGITMVLDIAYISIPSFRLILMGDKSEEDPAAMSGIRMNKEGDKSFLVSWEAIRAVKLAETEESGKHAIAIYLKRRIWMLIVLGICLVYLVQGQIYVFVGWILDLLNGFLGF